MKSDRLLSHTEVTYEYFSSLYIFTCNVTKTAREVPLLLFLNL